MNKKPVYTLFLSALAFCVLFGLSYASKKAPVKRTIAAVRTLPPAPVPAQRQPMAKPKPKLKKSSRTGVKRKITRNPKYWKKWRKNVSTNISKRIQRYLPGHNITCHPKNVWSLSVYPNAKRSTAVIMEELSPFLKQKLTQKQLKRIAKRIRHHVMGGIIRSTLLDGGNDNIGVLKLKGHFWTDAKGKKHPVLVFRGGFTKAPSKAGSCVHTLLRTGKVRHIVSLYDGDLLVVDDLRKQEKRAAQKVKASYVETRSVKKPYGHWRQALEEKATFKNPKHLRKVMVQMARLIREQILQPQGKTPRGNVFFHCGGGMHRSGLLAGVLRRCINKDPLPLIRRLFLYHSAYKGKKAPGGYEPLLLKFIKQFDCSLLKIKKAKKK